MLSFRALQDRSHPARDARRGIRAGLAPDPIPGSESDRRRCWITPNGVTAPQWPLRSNFGNAGTTAVARQPLPARTNTGQDRPPRGALDSAGYPDPGPSAEMRACGAMSRSIDPLFAQPSFPDGTGII